MCDALLGAAGPGDIGKLFPDTDPKWKGANSLLFLEHTRGLLGGKNFVIEYIDAVVILEKPKLGPHFPKIRGPRPRFGCFHGADFSEGQDSTKASTPWVTVRRLLRM